MADMVAPLQRFTLPECGDMDSTALSTALNGSGPTLPQQGEGDAEYRNGSATGVDQQTCIALAEVRMEPLHYLLS